jgi:hypothetical protein
MSDFVLPFALGAGALAVVLWFWRERQRTAPQRVLAALTLQARAELPPVQMTALKQELAEIYAMEQQMRQEGIAPDIAQRMSVDAGIQSIANHLAINRMLPG